MQKSANGDFIYSRPCLEESRIRYFQCLKYLLYDIVLMRTAQLGWTFVCTRHSPFATRYDASRASSETHGFVYHELRTGGMSDSPLLRE